MPKPSQSGSGNELRCCTDSFEFDSSCPTQPLIDGVDYQEMPYLVAELKVCSVLPEILTAFSSNSFSEDTWGSEHVDQARASIMKYGRLSIFIGSVIGLAHFIGDEENIFDT